MCKHREAFAGIKQHRKQKSLAEHIQEAKQLAKEHGALPNPRWLTTHGYMGLDYAKRHHPEAFAGIKQESKKGKSLVEHVHDAKLLVKKCGTLPNPRWLRDHGFGGLCQAMSKHPEAFANASQKRHK